MIVLTSLKRFPFYITSILMSSRTLRRRLHHGDVDGKSRDHFETSGLDSLSEPLLGEHDYSENNRTVRSGSILSCIETIQGCNSLTRCYNSFLSFLVNVLFFSLCFIGICY